MLRTADHTRMEKSRNFQLEKNWMFHLELPPSGSSNILQLKTALLPFLFHCRYRCRTFWKKILGRSWKETSRIFPLEYISFTIVIVAPPSGSIMSSIPQLKHPSCSFRYRQLRKFLRNLPGESRLALNPPLGAWHPRACILRSHAASKVKTAQQRATNKHAHQTKNIKYYGFVVIHFVSILARYGIPW